MSIEVPYDIAYEIPEGELRAVPKDPESMRQGVEWLRQRASLTGEPLERARYLGLSGVYAAMIGELVSARADLEDAVAIADINGFVRQQVVFRIRLADVIALSGDSGEAVTLLRSLLHRCEDESALVSLVDFIHQHLGKALLGAGEIQAGMEHLEHALELRQEKQDDELIASTRQALNLASRMRVGSGARKTH